MNSIFPAINTTSSGRPVNSRLNRPFRSEFIPHNGKLHLPRAILNYSARVHISSADAAAIEAAAATAVAAASAGDGARQN